MILAHIIVKNKKQALEIVSLLLEKKLLLHAAISKKIVYKRDKSVHNKLEKQKQTLIIGKTKALLFSSINKELKNHYLENMPILYAVPIVYMDEELSSILRTNTAKVPVL